MGILSQAARQRIQELSIRRRYQRDYFLGFPVAVDFDYRQVYHLFDDAFNNVGDPYSSSLSSIHTLEFEREVITFFANLFRATQNDRWGYVTTGGTEGNLFGLYLARNMYPDATLYYSAAAHYSVAKASRILNIKNCMVVPTQPSGEIDYSQFKNLLNSSKPAIILATVGTTMTEAKDDVVKLKQIATAAGVGHYIHTDAAMSGPYMPFIKGSGFDMADGADSISISGHKFIGSPFPCGVVITKYSHKEKIGQDVSYIDAADTTISGSRNGHASVLLWCALQRWGKDGLRQRLATSQRLANYTLKKLQSIGWQAWRNPQAITVVLRAPSEALTRKWQLATHNGWSHIVCMPGVSQARIDALIRDLQEE